MSIARYEFYDNIGSMYELCSYYDGGFIMNELCSYISYMTFIMIPTKRDTKCPVRVLPTCYTTGSNMYNMTNHAQIIFCSVNCLPYCHIYHVSACTSTVIEKGGFRLDLCCCQRPSIPHIMAASINWDIPSATPHLTIISIC